MGTVLYCLLPTINIYIYINACKLCKNVDINNHNSRMGKTVFTLHIQSHAQSTCMLTIFLLYISVFWIIKNFKAKKKKPFKLHLRWGVENILILCKRSIRNSVFINIDL